ncbi:hypothetical protein M426DRAFT_157598 [Hypoxylon sp. CI-4A]|nr:hypothetical protein M426DRAFT_157598 [Hypoxylon sp. CI-4A]
MDQRTVAKRRFYRIIEYFETSKNNNDDGAYKRPQLVRFTYEYALSEESRDNLLRAFFRAMALSMDDDTQSIDFEELRLRFFGFADHLLDNFFLPLKASTKKTLQPTPTFRSTFGEVQGAPAFVGTPARISALRGDCLVRDHHRCVISRKFDQAVATSRFNCDGDAALDDDGDLLSGASFDVLEVAHILPRSLVTVNSDSQLVCFALEGADIDRPRNAITLTHTLHYHFGGFKIFFEPDNQQPHTYRINSFLPRYISRDLGLPTTRMLYLTSTRTIDPPSPRLLAVHRAIAHILHFSAVGEYIDKLLRDMDEKDIQADGSTELDRMLRLRLGSVAG